MVDQNRLLAAARYFWEPAVLTLALFVITAAVSAIGNEAVAYTLTSGLIQTVLVVSLYIFIGNSGILAFGHIAYAMIGAYATAWLTMSPIKKSIALSLPNFLADNSFPLFPSSLAAALLAAIAAFITGLPLVRLSGIAASIGTFAVLAILNTVYSNWDSWTFGASTLLGVPLYVDKWIALAWVSATLFAASVHQKSRFGLALRASRENEVAARASGINVPFQRLVAFVLSGFFMGIGGVLQAHFLGTIAVTGFWIAATFMALAMLVIGGQRSLTGAVVGVIVVSALLEILRQLEVGVPIGQSIVHMPRGLRELGIALLMLIMLIARNAGLTGGREIPWPFGRNAPMRRTREPDRQAGRVTASSFRAASAITAGDDVNPTLEAHNVAVRFGGLAAIDDLTLTMRRGEVFGLIGPNGAGKSTLINVLTGFQKPSLGSVLLGGVDVTGRAPHLIARMGLARTFQAVRLFPDMTVFENLQVAAIGAGLSRREAGLRAQDILDWMRFERQAHVRAETLPYGDERRVGIARALATSPRFALLDEPAAGMSDAECDDLMGMIAQIPERFGCGVLLIEHNMRVIMGACHRIHVIDGGRTIGEGSPHQIKCNPEVIRAYLGSRSEKLIA